MRRMKRVIPIACAAVVFAACAPLEETNETTTGQAAGVLADDPAPMFRDAMRGLWSDHVVWTRAYIIAAVDGHSSAGAAAARLMQNQEEIGAAIAPYYGDEAGNQLTSLLKEHISIAVELVGAAKAGDQAGQTRADSLWHRNADEIAGFLSGANPTNWSKPALLDMLNEHLALTTTEAVNRLQQKWDADVVVFDQIHDQAMMMADALSAGIMKQFPTKF